ncbi:aminodeoxychorismate synthase component 2 [Andreesenia angusta]|uniref:Aminodeoxychorismate synthase component 2 n=1 Tax=Andreesenia angusta TaxID=39480 RepID=A0A1S1V9C3_9FIRM|nr:aminodeoxychorismate/anthranilate synthase component II [Andreesenia angusta]OHW63213.1 aminodeoxychorismate synthase component 2 [Andreesenia angusta]
MIVLIDNYDSFTYNLYQYLIEFEDDVRIYRNDKIDVKELEALKPDKIVISPGPGRPEEAGNTLDIIDYFKDKLPILGICLGHQSMGQVYGAEIVRAGEIVHGKTALVKTKANPLFKGLPESFKVMRYHSLIIDRETLSDEFDIIAETEDGLIMGIAHKRYPIYGLQFHPESILTEHGKEMIANFVEVI